MQRSLRKTCLSAGLVLALLTGGAHAYADDAPPKAPLTEEQSNEAKNQFTAGVNLLDDPDGAKYEQAFRAFKRAYEITQSPKILGNIAFCAFNLERDGEAIDAYTTYLREVPDISDRERTQIQRDLNTMTATVGRAKFTVKEEGKHVLIDKRTQTRGAPVENAYPFEGKEFSVRLRPGRHTFMVKSSEGESMPIDATVEPGASGTYEITMTRPATSTIADQPTTTPTKKEGSSIVGPIVMGSVGLAAIATGVVTGLMAQGKTSDIERGCPSNTCPATYDFIPDRTSAKTLGTVADVGFIGGGILVGGAVLWYLLTPSGSASAAPTKSGSAKSTAWLPAAGCSGTGCGFQLQRGF